ncbi:PTS system, fructose-specific IIA component / PTS system, fructose-specific IIB component / PTS system, fructose-specific IIC component [Lachnospiraceae bacterium TWA4]|nr:PTS system, fructose-specific IIA component / PTS system, fructose-specific IIB component / PTS system, fructose-specific IIC component [Lachnospiraceae bacterium TWA4]
MRINELLSKQAIDLNVSANSKAEVIDYVTKLMEKSGNLSDREAYKQGVLAREEESTTGIGDGIAIPHSKNAAVKKAGLAAAVIPKGVDYESLDDEPVYLMFMIAAPEGGNNTHLEALARLSTMLMDPDFKDALLAAKSADEFLKVISDKEDELDGKKKAEAVANANTSYRVLAITACPTGIAHTFMAAESLENKGKELGIPVKVETQGADGAKNVLTAEEIANAECIIIAADKNVDLARFDGKPLIKTKVADGIHKADELINKAVSGEVAPYHHVGGAATEEEAESESIGRQIYKHLMNGVSHMLPFVIGGGILIALAFLLDDYSIDPSNFGKNTPVAAYLKTIGEQAFGMMLPILAGYIAMSIADRPGLAVGVVAGLVAKMGATFANPGGGDVNAGFLGALFAGFAAGYIVLLLKKLTSKFPASLNSLRPMIIYPIIGTLLGALVTTAINPIMGVINEALNSALAGMGGSSKIILGIIVAGMMSVDMGGPVNKASYAFAIAQLEAGNFEIMAAVMAGGMVPPLVIALCTTIFKNRFTKSERESGLVNYILGLSFISEGAIPFAAGDPLRVIPSCVVGSAVAGALSMAFGCTLRAPHGGIFVLPTIGNPAMYAVAIAAGMVVGALVLGVLKKPVENK